MDPETVALTVKLVQALGPDAALVCAVLYVGVRISKAIAQGFAISGKAITTAGTNQSSELIKAMNDHILAMQVAMADLKKLVIESNHKIDTIIKDQHELDKRTVSNEVMIKNIADTMRG